MLGFKLEKLTKETKYRNAHISEGDKSFIDCEIRVDGEWQPTSIPLDLSDPINEELGKEILSSHTKPDLNRVVRNDKLVIIPKEEIIKKAKDDLTSAKEKLIYKLEAACTGMLEGGFQSNATGSMKSYGSSKTDQLNMASSVACGVGCYVACLPEGEYKWARQLHSPEELKLLIQHYENFKYSVLSKLDRLREKVKKTKTLETLDGISW